MSAQELLQRLAIVNLYAQEGQEDAMYEAISALETDLGPLGAELVRDETRGCYTIGLLSEEEALY